MNTLLKTFGEILLLRKGPEDLPASAWLLRLTFVVYCLVGLVAMAISGRVATNFAGAMAEIAVDVLYWCLWFWGLLSFYGRRQRLQQVLTAALGCGSLLGIMFLPVFALTMHTQPVDPAQPATPGLLLAAMLYVGLLCWTASVIGHIAARALDFNRLFGLGLGVLFVVAELALMSALFPLQG